jgi:hypothetical protein
MKLSLHPFRAAEEIRTPTPLRAQRPQRCLSTSFNTAAWFFNRSANVTAILVFSKNKGQRLRIMRKVVPFPTSVLLTTSEP